MNQPQVVCIPVARFRHWCTFVYIRILPLLTSSSYTYRFKELRLTKKKRNETMASQSPRSPSTSKDSPGVTCALSKPQLPPGKDKASFDRHNNALVIDYRKFVPNMTVVNSLMDASFAMT
uniref:Uncharacterized protein n=1 Tax=Amphimedon queenslandica TaxID=400682 RepID=A0A1X7V5Y0_AMPQE